MSKKFQFPIDKVLNPDPSNAPVRISSYFDWSKFSDFLEECKSNQVKEKTQNRKRKIPISFSVGCSPTSFNKRICLSDEVEKNKRSYKRRANSFSEPSESYLSKFTYVISPIKLSSNSKDKEIGHSYVDLEKNCSPFDISEQISEIHKNSSPTGLSRRLSASSELLSPLTVYDCDEFSGVNSHKSPENGFHNMKGSNGDGDTVEKKMTNGINYSSEPMPPNSFFEQSSEEQDREVFSEESQDKTFTSLMESSPPNVERHQGETEREHSGSSFLDDPSSKASFFQPEFNSIPETQIVESEFLGQPIELIEALLKISSYTPENSTESQNSNGSSQTFAPSMTHTDTSALNVLSLAAMAVEREQNLHFDDNNYTVTADKNQITYLSATESNTTISRAEYRRLSALQSLISQVDDLKLLEFLLNSS